MSRATSEKQESCWLLRFIRSSPRVGRAEEKGVSVQVRVKRWLKRRLSLKAEKKIKGFISSAHSLFDRNRVKPARPDAASVSRLSVRLEAGDWVRVRPREEIEDTLDHWHSFKGCGFLDEMTRYCGTKQRVFKRVERFIDERDYRLKKASGVVLLDGVTCSGTGTTGRCDRSCFFFWREEWLEKVH